MDIIEFVNREIRDAGYADRLPYGVVLTGGGANLQQVDALFERELGLSVRVGIPEEGIGSESLGKVNAPEFATIVGLLHRGVEADDKGVGKSCTVEIVVEEPTQEAGDLYNAPPHTTSYQSQLSQKPLQSPHQKRRKWRSNRSNIMKWMQIAYSLHSYVRSRVRSTRC